MQSILERQAIRTAVALAAASAHGQSPQAIADIRDEAMQLIAYCTMHPSITPEELGAWCDDAAALMQRLGASGALPDEQVLQASAAILRLRLAVTRVALGAGEPKDNKARSASRDNTGTPPPQRKVKLAENLKKVAGYIQEHPDIRSKELIEHFSGVFSSRSIKRYVAELLVLKVIHRKEIEDGSIAYTTKL